LAEQKQLNALSQAAFTKRINLLCIVVAILTAVIVTFSLTLYFMGYKIAKADKHHIDDGEEGNHFFKDEMKGHKSIDDLYREEMAIEEMNQGELNQGELLE